MIIGTRFVIQVQAGRPGAQWADYRPLEIGATAGEAAALLQQVRAQVKDYYHFRLVKRTEEVISD